jgi:hypothetical protein
VKTVKRRISLIKGKVEEVLPTDEDIFGYQGINKEKILESLNESYDLLNSLEEYDDKLEIVFLKRKIHDLFEKVSLYLKDGIQQDDRNTTFNQFINYISDIRYSVKEAYIIVAKDPIRAEIEIKNTKDNLVELKNEYQSIKELYSSIESIRNKSQTFLKTLVINIIN